MKKFNFEKFGFYRNIFFICFFALFLCLLLLVTTLDVHAESLNPLPYEVVNYDNWTNRDGFSMQDLQNYFNNRWGEYYPTNFFTDGTFVLEYTEVSGARSVTETNYTYVFVPSDSSSYVYADPAINYSVFDTSTDSLTLKGYNYKVVLFSYNRNRYNDPDFSNTGFQNISITPAIHPSTSYSNILYNYYNNGVQYTDDVLIGYPVVIPDATGHATQPINDPNNFINGSGGNPISRPTRPTPNPFNPSVWNSPSIDTSTIETLLKSIWECLEYGFDYLKDNLSGWFDNLLSNLDSWFGYVVDSVFYATNKIVQSIQDLATDLYNNFVSLFEPLYAFLSSVSTFFNTLVGIGTDENGDFNLTTFFVNLLIPDTDDLSASLLQGDIFAVIPLSFAIKNFVDTFIYTINNLQVSKVFTIPGFTAFGQTFPSYQMDFSWFDDYKPYSDTIISGFLLIGYMHWFFVQASSMLRGAGVVGHEQSTDASKKVGD